MTSEALISILKSLKSKCLGLFSSNFHCDDLIRIQAEYKGLLKAVSSDKELKVNRNVSYSLYYRLDENSFMSDLEFVKRRNPANFERAKAALVDDIDFV